MDKNTVIQRAKQATQLDKALKGIRDDMDKIPSFTGKAKFMDKVIKACTHSHNLAWDLNRDRLDAK